MISDGVVCDWCLINGTRHVRGKMSEVPVDVIAVGSLLVLHICYIYASVAMYV